MKYKEEELQNDIEKLKQESALKTGWISLISHDLIENFSSLLWIIDAVQNETISREDFFKLLPRIKQDTAKNLQTVSNTSEWIKTQYGGFKPKIAAVSVFDLFQKLRKQNQKKLSNKKLDFQFHGNKSTILKTDQFLILFILNKVLDNAIKYSQFEQAIHFKTNEDDHFFELSIIDFGIGMSAENIEQLFSFDAPVFKGTNGEVGAGLSLKIVKHFVSLLNGKLEAYSSEKEETKIAIFLPKIEK